MTIGEGEPTPDPAVEELVFLARSRHRIRLLTELSREERTRRELHDATGISQPTLGRILSDFEGREWISNNHNGAFNLTPLGELLADEVGGALDVIETIDRLTDVADHLPLDRLGFDLHCLSTSTVTTPSSADPLAHMRRFDELAAGATTVEMFSNVISCAPANERSGADTEFLVHVDELVVTEGALRTDLEDPDLREWLHGRIEDDELALYGYEGSAPFLFGIFDGTVGIVPIDGDGMPRGLIESETEPIRTWARESFDEYRSSATRLTPDSFPS